MCENYIVTFFTPFSFYKIKTNWVHVILFHALLAQNKERLTLRRSALSVFAKATPS
jgi:hypothetical protein